jgi:hypothetical protein
VELRAAGGKIEAWQNPPWIYFRLFHGANTWNANHFKVGKLEDNVWCRRFRDAKTVCSAEEAALHHTVMAVYHDWPGKPGA